MNIRSNVNHQYSVHRLQPPGKTSVVKYLAGLTGTKVIRINNHEHTDIQEYVGSYCVGDNDKLVFKEGFTCVLILLSTGSVIVTMDYS